MTLQGCISSPLCFSSDLKPFKLHHVDRDGKSVVYDMVIQDGKFTCPLDHCTTSFSYKRNFFRHLKEKHGENTTTLEETEVDRAVAIKEADTILATIQCRKHHLYPLIICINDGCQHALDPESLSTHVDNHGLFLNDESLAKILTVHKPLGPKEFAATYPVPYHYVDMIDVSDGYHCPVDQCLHVASDEMVLKKHCFSVHSSKSLSVGYMLKPYQQIFGPKSSRDLVTGYINADAHSLRTRFLESIPEPAEHELKDLNAAMLSPFLRASGWHKHLVDTEERAGVSAQDYYKLAHRCKGDLSESETWVKDNVLEICEAAGQLTAKSDTLVLKLLATKEYVTL